MLWFIIRPAFLESITSTAEAAQRALPPRNLWLIKQEGKEIYRCAEDAMTADWQRHTTLVLTPAPWPGWTLNHGDLQRGCSWEEPAVKQQTQAAAGTLAVGMAVAL